MSHTRRQSSLWLEIIDNQPLVVRVSDVVKTLTNHVLLSQPYVGGDGLANVEDGPLSVQNYQKPVHGLGGGGAKVKGE